MSRAKWPIRFPKNTLESFGPLIQLYPAYPGKKVEVPPVVIMIMLEHRHLASYDIPLKEHLLSERWGTMNLENAASRVLNFIPNRTNAAPATVSS